MTTLLNLYSLYAMYLNENLEYESSKQVLLEGIGLAGVNGKFENLTDFLNQLGVANLKLGEFVEAKQAFEGALAFESMIDPRVVVPTYLHLGELFMKTDEHYKAEEIYLEGSKLAKKVQDHPSLADLYLAIGELKRIDGKVQEAIKYYSFAQKIAQQNSYIRKEYRAVLKLADYHREAPNKDLYQTRLLDLALEIEEMEGVRI